jgi:hypothetical protein
MVKLTINSNYIHLYDDELILSSVFTDDINDLREDFSFSFDIPFSKNRVALNLTQDLGQINKFNYEGYKGFLEVNGNTLLECMLFISEIDVEVDVINVFVTSNKYQWVEDLNFNLKEWREEIPFTVNANTSSLINPNFSDTNNIFINNARLEDYNLQAEPIMSFGLLSYGVFFKERRLEAYNLTPVFQIKQDKLADGTYITEQGITFYISEGFVQNPEVFAEDEVVLKVVGIDNLVGLYREITKQEDYYKIYQEQDYTIEDILPQFNVWGIMERLCRSVGIFLDSSTVKNDKRYITYSSEDIPKYNYGLIARTHIDNAPFSQSPPRYKNNLPVTFNSTLIRWGRLGGYSHTLTNLEWLLDVYCYRDAIVRIEESILHNLIQIFSPNTRYFSTITEEQYTPKRLDLINTHRNYYTSVPVIGSLWYAATQNVSNSGHYYLVPYTGKYRFKFSFRVHSVGEDSFFNPTGLAQYRILEDSGNYVRKKICAAFVRTNDLKLINGKIEDLDTDLILSYVDIVDEATSRVLENTTFFLEWEGDLERNEKVTLIFVTPKLSGFIVENDVATPEYARYTGDNDYTPVFQIDNASLDIVPLWYSEKEFTPTAIIPSGTNTQVSFALNDEANLYFHQGDYVILKGSNNENPVKVITRGVQTLILDVPYDVSFATAKITAEFVKQNEEGTLFEKQLRLANFLPDTSATDFIKSIVNYYKLDSSFRDKILSLNKIEIGVDKPTITHYQEEPILEPVLDYTVLKIKYLEEENLYKKLKFEQEYKTNTVLTPNENEISFPYGYSQTETFEIINMDNSTIEIQVPVVSKEENWEIQPYDVNIDYSLAPRLLQLGEYDEDVKIRYYDKLVSMRKLSGSEKIENLGYKYLTEFTSDLSKNKFRVIAYITPIDYDKLKRNRFFIIKNVVCKVLEIESYNISTEEIELIAKTI